MVRGHGHELHRGVHHSVLVGPCLVRMDVPQKDRSLVGWMAHHHPSQWPVSPPSLQMVVEGHRLHPLEVLMAEEDLLDGGGGGDGAGERNLDVPTDPKNPT